MIDAWAVASNLLWIAGLAIVLAALSWQRWIGGQDPTRRPASVALNVGLALFCAGMAATGRGWSERVLWALLAAVWAARTLAGRA